MNTYYFDWSMRHGLYVLKNDEKTHKIYTKFSNFLDTLTEPSIICGESTFESFWPEERTKTIERCEQDGHELKTFNTRVTGRWRKKVYPKYNNKPLPDDKAVSLIRRIVKSGVQLQVPVAYKISINDTAENKLMRLRNNRIVATITRGKNKGNYKLVPEKDVYAENLISKLPDYKTLSSELKEALGNGTKYSKVIVAAIGVATEYSNNRREFEKLTGLYQGAYGNIIRSDLHMHGWNPRRKRNKITISQYRKSCRWLFWQLKLGSNSLYQLKNTGIYLPATGKIVP